MCRASLPCFVKLTIEAHIWIGDGNDFDVDRQFVAHKLAQLFGFSGSDNKDDEEKTLESAGKGVSGCHGSAKRQRDQLSCMVNEVVCFAPCLILRHLVLMDG